MKKVIFLLIITIIITVIDLFLVSVPTNVGYVTSSAQARVSLIVESDCGDGTCNTDESCSTCPADCGSCLAGPVLGGGGGSVLINTDFTVDPSIINVLANQGESVAIAFVIKNTGNVEQIFRVSANQGITNMIFISENSFLLTKGQQKIIQLTFNSLLSTIPDAYTGLLRVATSHKYKEIPIIFNVKSAEVLFDASLEIPAESREISPGEDLILQVTLFNLKNNIKTKVNMDYIIKDMEGREILRLSDAKEVTDQLSFERIIKLGNLSVGDYVAVAQVKYDSSTGVSAAMFHVIGEETKVLVLLKNKYIILAVSLIIIILIIYFWRRYIRAISQKLQRKREV